MTKETAGNKDHWKYRSERTTGLLVSLGGEQPLYRYVLERMRINYTDVHLKTLFETCDYFKG